MCILAIVEIKHSSERSLLGEIFSSNYKMLISLAMTIVGEEHAEDVVTNAMLSLFSLVPKLRLMEERERVAYLRATVRNAAYKYYNAQKRR